MLISKETILQARASIEAAKVVRLDDSKDRIRKAFMSYTRHATDMLSEPISEKEPQDSIRLAYIAPVHRLRSLVEGLESSAEFKRLCSALVRELKKKDLRDDFAASALENFFKRSHFYTDIHDGKNLNLDELFESFWALIPTRRIKTTWLRPMNECWFESRHLDFGLFKIQKFTKQELDGLIDRQTRAVFYPYAGGLDTESVSECWHIVEETFTDRDLGSDLDSLMPHFSETGLDRKVPDRVIQFLALHYSFAGVNFHGGWSMPPFLPFTLTVDDDLFSSPASVPEHSELAAPQVIGDEDPLDEAEEVGAVRTYNCVEFGREEELRLKKIVENVQWVLKVTEVVEDWNFIDIALGYLGKAWVTHEGLDQLLWNVAVLDALLSEEDAGVRQVMRPRIGNILGASDPEKKEIRKQFDELYAFRSDLVHGKKYTRKAQGGDLENAREMARQAVMWFIDYLLWVDEGLRHQKVNYEHYPRRKELLSVLDFDRTALDRLHLLIGTFPQNFPSLSR